jgi:UTP--glucose-1-phosphate uridylyltransferase
VTDVIEKPELSAAPSRLALPGRYVFSNEIFKYLRKAKPAKNGEIQLTDGMTGLAQNEGLLATQFVAKRFDAGDKLGYLIANIEFGLMHDEVKNGLRKYLKELSGKI